MIIYALAWEAENEIRRLGFVYVQISRELVVYCRTRGFIHSE